MIVQTFKMGESGITLENVLNLKEIRQILDKALDQDEVWKLVDSEVRPAVDGIAGFLGDHLKVALIVEGHGERKKVPLFVKRLPKSNKPKAEFIDENNFFRREELMYKVLEKICDYGPNPWCIKTYICTDSIIVLPDLSFEGYSPRHYLQSLDLEHVLLTTSSIARLHATFTNYETKKSIDVSRPYHITEDYSEILAEPTFIESPFLRACSKLSANLLKKFSKKPFRDMPDLEAKLTKLYIEACDTLTEYDETLNVLLHRDLWVNNLLFKYENNVPTTAILIDFQCLRYGPPGFDLMVFLYLTTDRSFREANEKVILEHYYKIFSENINDDSKKRLKDLAYDKESFLQWCERGRMFGIFESIAISPFVLMDPKTAQQTFDNPATFKEFVHEDRSEPVLAYADSCEGYRVRNLEVTEEFVERYVLDKL